MIDLMRKLEAATEGSRELDAEICGELTGWFPSHLCNDNTRRSYGAGFLHKFDDGSNLLSKDGKVALHYSTSLDAALTLVPEGWGTSQTNTHEYNDNMWQWGLWCFSNLQEVSSVCVKKSPALALCVAVLKAREKT